MLYLKLFHGRKDPAEQTNDWGSDGPIFGPYQYAHTTYSHHLKLGRVSDDVDELFVTSEDLIYYDGMYYGDWSVFPENILEKHDQTLHQAYDPNKARLPKVQDNEKYYRQCPMKIIVYIKGGVCLDVKTNLPENCWEYALVDYDDDPDLPDNHVPFINAEMTPLPSLTAFLNLLQAARETIARWEKGDLAAAVRKLARIANQIETP
jgi:hypothetical protein